MKKRMSSFSKYFAWGAAAAAYQIEGAWNEGGRAPSIWDMFSQQPGKVQGGETGNTACDHYHRYQEDIRLMSLIGLKAYRLSISWSRVLPAGTGSVNEEGIGFYDRLVDELMTHGIEPWVTLYHWDLPYELHLRGGWLNPEMPKWFADYTAVVVDRLSDRVRHWITLNEPQCYIDLGYSCGKHAPGLQMGMREVLTAAHHSLMAHGTAVQTLRAHAKKPSQVGWAPCGIIYYPATTNSEDIEAARQATLGMNGTSLWNNAWWYEPVYHGHYPEEGLRAYGKDLPRFASKDFETIQQKLDFCGCNLYNGTATKQGEAGAPQFLPPETGAPHTHFPVQMTPEAMYWGPKFLFEEYQLPIVITENGLANSDWVALDGRVHDETRIDFTHRYLLALHQAAEEGIEIHGYFHWSILDNFEWIKGYRFRFGLVFVDYQTKERKLKDSALWYREVIQSNGASLFKAVEVSGAPLKAPEVVSIKNQDWDRHSEKALVNS